MQNVLKRTDFKKSALSSAPSVDEALEALRRANYDLIILNVEAHNVESVIKLCGHTKSTPVILIGNQSDEDQLIVDSISLGAQDYLPKEQISPHGLEKCITYAIERQQIQEGLRELSLTDELTKLYNRRGFLQLTEQQISFAKRHMQPLILFSIDVNFFKQINDAHGHPTGDRALLDLTECLRASFRKHDIIGRIGGDEFAVVAINTNRSGELISHLLEKVEVLNSSNARPYTLSLSIGESTFDPATPSTLDDLLASADKNLYVKKKEIHDLDSR